MTTDTKEKAFQQDIIDYLESTGYVVRSTKDYHVKSFLDVELVLKFIKTSQLMLGRFLLIITLILKQLSLKLCAIRFVNVELFVFFVKVLMR